MPNRAIPLLLLLAFLWGGSFLFVGVAVREWPPLPIVLARVGLATLALTIPAVGAVSVWLGQPLVLGLGPKEMVLLALTFAVSILTLGGGRTTVLHGAVHLVILAAWACLLVAP